MKPGERQGGVCTAFGHAGDLHWNFFGNSAPFPFGVMEVEGEVLMKPQKWFSALGLLWVLTSGFPDFWEFQFSVCKVIGEKRCSLFSKKTSRMLSQDFMLCYLIRS